MTTDKSSSLSTQFLNTPMGTIYINTNQQTSTGNETERFKKKGKGEKN